MLLVFKEWKQTKGGKRLRCSGWFLFGWIPLVVIERDYDLPSCNSN